MLTRQKILLKLLMNSGGSASKLQLVKLCFLLSQEGRSEQLKSFYEFLPYKFGPYSFGLAHELDNLVREGCIIMRQNEEIELTSMGKKASHQAFEVRLARDIELIGKNYGTVEQNKLIEMVYEKHPWFTANSQFANKRRAKVPKADCSNYTIGYQSFQIDGLLNILLESGIKRLLDTRSNPISRRYGYHKSTLSRLCGFVGIAYEHVAEVGVPSDWRQELETEAEYKSLFLRYEKEVLNRDPGLIEAIANKMIEIPSALLCREARPRECHRSILAKRLASLNGCPIVNLSCSDSEPSNSIFK